MTTQHGLMTSLETIANTEGLWQEVRSPSFLPLSTLSYCLQFTSLLEPISFYNLSHVSRVFRQRYHDAITHVIYDIVDVHGAERRTLIGLAEAGCDDRLTFLLRKLITAKTPHHFRQRIFERYLSLATETVEKTGDDELSFGDFRHFGTLCLVADKLGVARPLGLSTKASFLAFARMTRARGIPTTDKEDRIIRRLYTTFFLGHFVASHKSARAVAAEMVNVPKGYYHDCHCAAFPLSMKTARYHDELPWLKENFSSSKTTIHDLRPPTATQIFYNPLLAKDPQLSWNALVQSTKNLSPSSVLASMAHAAPSFEAYFQFLSASPSAPRGHHLDEVLRAAEREEMRWSSKPIVDFIYKFSQMPRDYYSRGHENTWIYHIILFAERAQHLSTFRDVISVFCAILTANERFDLLDIHFDCTELGVAALRKVLVFTILNVGDFNLALDTVLLGRCQKGLFLLWEKDNLWPLAKSMPTFRRYVENSFAHRFSVATEKKESRHREEELARMLPFYADVREELQSALIKIPIRGTNRGRYTYQSSAFIPGMKSGLIEQAEWKAAGFTSVLPGNSDVANLRQLISSLDEHLEEDFVSKHQRRPEKRALYDSEDEEEERRFAKRPRTLFM